eukprot:CAMPEP_0174939576 /NCGR_PEP_ID=MMETSP1355-20121228/67017_1 /TAXON_ID=464990 /ORGANISM="Hemiselmis tepida, Strain CCMP443" /LENGTH=39 /DNA_ID= /DNA_START= /DNA_END= /DNA_ORIENTATION=
MSDNFIEEPDSGGGLNKQAGEDLTQQAIEEELQERRKYA